MKNLSQIITTILSVLFFGYIFYTYEPVQKTEKAVEKKNAAYGLWGQWESGNIKEEFGDLEISNKGELNLIINMIKEYNQMNASNLSSFFADSCDFHDLSGNTQTINHEDFDDFFNSLDSIMWTPVTIVPLKLKDETGFFENSRTGTLVHSIEQRYKKDGSVWAKELLEVFYIKDNKIISVNQFGKEFDEYGSWR